MPGFMPDIHGFFAGEAFFPFLLRHFERSFRTARERRARNPDAGTTLVSGFRIRSLRPRPE
jgi:hypothetical protein